MHTYLYLFVRKRKRERGRKEENKYRKIYEFAQINKIKICAIVSCGNRMDRYTTRGGKSTSLTHFGVVDGPK